MTDDPDPFADFYRFFDQHTNQGRVLDQDLSRLDLRPISPNPPAIPERIILTDGEVQEREAWFQLLRGPLHTHYRKSFPPTPTSVDEFLRMRILPPALSRNRSTVSTRTSIGESRVDRQYPNQVNHWAEFRGMVAGFTPPRSARVPETIQLDPMRSFKNTEFGNEEEEKSFTFNNVLKPLQGAGLIHEPQNSGQGAVGDPDKIVFGPSRTAVVLVEDKATHNLPWPMTGAEVAQQYMSACTTNPPTTQSVREWTHIGHALAQLVGYLLANRCRCGVVTCGTRTYFVYIKQSRGQNVSVDVSDAWFIGVLLLIICELGQLFTDWL